MPSMTPCQPAGKCVTFRQSDSWPPGMGRGVGAGRILATSRGEGKKWGMKIACVCWLHTMHGLRTILRHLCTPAQCRTQCLQGFEACLHAYATASDGDQACRMVPLCSGCFTGCQPTIKLALSEFQLACQLATLQPKALRAASSAEV